jgi:hypothetical protein
MRVAPTILALQWTLNTTVDNTTVAWFTASTAAVRNEILGDGPVPPSLKRRSAARSLRAKGRLDVDSPRPAGNRAGTRPRLASRRTSSRPCAGRRDLARSYWRGVDGTHPQWSSRAAKVDGDCSTRSRRARLARARRDQRLRRYLCWQQPQSRSVALAAPIAPRPPRQGNAYPRNSFARSATGWSSNLRPTTR